MRNQLKIVYSVLAVVAMSGLTGSVHGVPSFARQTGLDCNSCHSAAGFPTLNTFGQAFKAGGFTQANEDSLMGDGEALSIPKTLNLAVIAKMRYTGTSTTKLGAVTPNTTAVSVTNPTGLNDLTKTTATPSSEVNLPDEWAIWLTGRAGKHVGFATEFNGEGALSFKLPIVYDLGPLKVGVVPYWTDAQGPGWFFETMSTGAVGNIKLFEGGAQQSARMYLEGTGLTGNGGATAGAGIYIWHPMGFVGYSPYLTQSSKVSFAAVEPHYGHYFRAAFTPSFGGIDIGVGIQYMMGNMNFGAGSTMDGVATPANMTAAGGNAQNFVPQNYFGIDGQVMGTFGIPMALVVTWGTTNNLKDASGTAVAGQTATATTILLNFTLVEDLLNLGGGVRLASHTFVDAKGVADGTMVGNAKTTDNNVLTNNAAIVEVKFNLARNVRLSLTGYMDLGAVDVVDSKGVLLHTGTNNAGTTSVANLTNEKQSALRFMVFGGF